MRYSARLLLTAASGLVLGCSGDGTGPSEYNLTGDWRPSRGRSISLVESSRGQVSGNMSTVYDGIVFVSGSRNGKEVSLTFQGDGVRGCRSAFTGAFQDPDFVTGVMIGTCDMDDDDFQLRRQKK